MFTSVSTSNGLKTRGRSCSSGAALLTSTSSGGYGGGLSPSPIAAETSSSSAAAALPPSVTIPRQVKGLFAGPYQLLKPECLTRYSIAEAQTNLDAKKKKGSGDRFLPSSSPGLPSSHACPLVRWKAYCEATDKVVAIQLLPPGPNAMELAREMLTATPDASGTRVVDCGRCEVLGPFAVYATGSGSPHTNLSTPVPMPQPPAATASVASPSPPTVFYVNTPLTRAASTLRHTPSPTSTPPRNRAWAPTSPPESPPSANGSNSNSGNTSSGASVCSSGDALTPMSCSISSAATTPSSTPCPIQTDAGATEETFAPRAMCKFSLRQEPCRTVNCRFLHYPGLKPTTDEELAALPPLRRPAPGCGLCGSG